MALVASSALHILALLAVNGATHPLLYRPTGRLGILLQLPSARLPAGHRLVSSVVSEATTAAIPIVTSSQMESTPPELANESTIPLPSIATYRRRSELEAPAFPLATADLPQPLEPLDGRAVLTLLLGENGKVDAVLTRESSFPPEYFRRIQEFFSAMTFEPGMIDGKPQKSRFEIEISTLGIPEILESKLLIEKP